MIVGVAGKYCSGKSTVTTHLVNRGFMEINLDSLGHEALKMETPQVLHQFGTGIQDEFGSIDRKKLGSIVFEDADRRRLLESIVHPRMVSMVHVLLAEHSGENIVIDGALLFYMGLGHSCDLAFWVSAPFFLRYVRALRRDRLPLGKLLQRFKSQRDLTPQPSSYDVDIYYITNTGSPAALKERVDQILSRERM